LQAIGGVVPPTPSVWKDRVMGEFNKDPNQSGTGKEQQGEKPAFGQFEKGQQGQEEFGQEKGKEPYGQEKGKESGQDKESYGQDKAGQQYAEEKPEFGQEKQDQSGKGGQQQFEKQTQRQQGDEDLGDDSIDNQNLK
jgi:hypothetical protein